MLGKMPNGEAQMCILPFQMLITQYLRQECVLLSRDMYCASLLVSPLLHLVKTTELKQ